MERLELETVLPPGHLRPFVRRYLYANRRLDCPATFRGRPTGYAYFSSFFGPPGNERGTIDGRPFANVSNRFLLGQITNHELRFHHLAALRLIVAELSATGHYRLFGLTGQKALGLAAPFHEAVPEGACWASDCFRLGPSAGRADHVAEANRFFSGLAEGALPADALVEDAVTMLEASDGNARIADVCRRLDADRRTLNRRFQRIVGVAPKFFARVMQINRAVDLLYSGGDAELAQVAQEAGFYDQAHLNHAMQRFFQEGPRDFIRSDHHVYRSFLAGSRRYGRRPRPRRSNGQF